MIIGVPKEIKNHEYRVGLVTNSVRELVSLGHQVLVESDAGIGIGLTNEDYRTAGATIISTAKELFTKSEMIVKVKEPLAAERIMLRQGQILFTYLHLAPDLTQTKALIASKSICIAYETVKNQHGQLPLLAPMSEVAGRMSIQAGAQSLENSHGGCGLLLSGIPGVLPTKVLILGGGVVGSNAARMAVGMRADVTLLDSNINALRRLDLEFQGKVKLAFASQTLIDELVPNVDMIIGAVLIPGAQAPKLITEQHVKNMKAGSALVDVAIDQGGCFETSRPTTHEEPTYILHDVVHYCVANMPGAVARTSTFALNNATLPYIINIAEHGYKQALLNDEGFMAGLNIIHGKVTCPEVAEAFDLHLTDAETALHMH